MKMTLEQAQEQIDELRERVRQLEHDLGATSIRPFNSLGLSGHGRTLMGMLALRKFVSKEAMMNAMYPGRDGGPEYAIRVMRLTVMRLRKKLQTYGVKIKTVNGLGYEISDEDQVRLRALTGNRNNE